MPYAIDEATSRFLETAQADLQRHLDTIGTVVSVTVVPTGDELRLDAVVRVGSRNVIFSGTGESVVAAYGAPQPTDIEAYATAPPHAEVNRWKSTPTPRWCGERWTP